jgi:hypothetical protein
MHACMYVRVRLCVSVCARALACVCVCVCVCVAQGSLRVFALLTVFAYGALHRGCLCKGYQIEGTLEKALNSRYFCKSIR